MRNVSAIFIACFSLSVTVSGTSQTSGDLPDLVISSENNYWKTGTLTKVTSGTPDITVDNTIKKQNWEGFGGTFNEMGWDALSVVKDEIPKALKMLFDAKDGANFTFGRIPIGASDYSMSWYTLAETAGDYSMQKFSISRDQQKLIPYIKAALEVKPDIHLWGSPWICPDWMKSGQNFKNDEQTLKAYALYFAKFVQEYGKTGLTIEAIHHQNEPGYAQVKWTNQLFVDFLKKYLGPEFEKQKLKTEIWCGTMSNPLDSTIAIDCMKDDDAMKYIVGFGLQWNLESVVPTLSKKGRIWQTEHRCGNYNFETKYWDVKRYSSSKPQNDHLYGEESWLLIRDWISAGVHAYNTWNMVLDTYGKSLHNWPQNALLVVDRSAKKLIVTPAYWVFRHFSQYIQPGATRIGASGSDEVLAFMNPDGFIITQVYNKDDTQKELTISVSGGLYHLTIPAHSWATLRTTPPTKAVDFSGINNSSKEKQLQITVTQANVRVALPTSESGKMELLSPSGVLLKSTSLKNPSHEISLSRHTLPSGLFLLRVVQGKATNTARILNTF
ncbi:MAG TPA: glycoside hydrolase family 30 beta sandwich domain-containing protein [Chitinispirillaceae bacterium]|nr:glycoside hydrolase family 30 beta sandwich domain-containing protein [Chitinispirillaceae bacterium]